MFKNFLTHHFALGFERLCFSLDPQTCPERDELVRCCKGMLVHLDLAIRATQDEERAKSLFVALTYLKDCGEILVRTSSPISDIRIRHEILMARLERIFWESGKSENGQLRMLG